MAIGGVLFALLVLRPAVRARPALASPLGRTLPASAAGAAVLGGAQLLALAVQLGARVGGGGGPVRELVASPSVRAAAARVLACVGLVVGCLRVRRAAGTGLGWVALLGGALALAMSAAWTSHAAARLGPRGLLLTLDGLHQVAAAAWIGGLGHLVLTALGRGVHAWPALLLKRFSALALTAVAVLVVAGLALTLSYVGGVHALLGTSYGMMVLSKVGILAGLLTLGGMNFLAVRLLAILYATGRARWARHWPLIFLGLAGFLLIRNDPGAWPLGPLGFWESMAYPEVLQHRVFVLLVVAFAFFEWMVRTGRLRSRRAALVFPLLCAVGSGLLLTHSHAGLNLKEEFLMEVTHAPLGLLGMLVGWGRWLELRLPSPEAWVPRWLWSSALAAVGVLLLFYRES